MDGVISYRKALQELKKWIFIKPSLVESMRCHPHWSKSADDGGWAAARWGWASPMTPHSQLEESMARSNMTLHNLREPARGDSSLSLPPTHPPFGQTFTVSADSWSRARSLLMRQRETTDPHYLCSICFSCFQTLLHRFAEKLSESWPRPFTHLPGRFQRYFKCLTSSLQSCGLSSPICLSWMTFLFIISNIRFHLLTLWLSFQCVLLFNPLIVLVVACPWVSFLLDFCSSSLWSTAWTAYSNDGCQNIALNII